MWGYTKEQEKIIEKFIKERAYSEMYNRLTASLFPQIISLIDNCNAREQKGCKRDVSKRLRELTDLMKEELNSLHKGNIARYHLRPSEYDHWRKLNRT